MKNKTSNKTSAVKAKNIRAKISKSQLRGLAVVAIVALAGVVWLTSSRAAGFTVPAEAEAGVLAGAATKITSSAASGGSAVRFGSSGMSTGFRSIKGQPLYVYKPSEWSGRPGAIYNYQVGKWYGNWITDIQASVNEIVTLGAAAGQLPLLSAYNIPGRDCGSYSSGGAGNSANYRTWIQRFADGIGNRKAIVILEADALAQIDCLNANDQNARIADIAFATTTLRDKTQASVYIDGGNAGWKSVSEMADLLKKAGVANASGFSLNVSNFKFTDASATYGDEIVEALKTQGVPNARYVIDTSRNGKGPAPTSELSWCNPSGRGLGKRPSTNPTVGTYNDGFLWIKTIGESDGECERGDPPAGQWFPSYAQMLIDNAVY